jgi:hypothetical protein
MAKTTEDLYKELIAKGNQYQKDADSYLSAYDNRPAFSYNPNADAAYRVMRDQYMHQGQRAMQDTMGQAAGLTGGYNNSYAQAVGNQAYNEYLTKIGGLSVDMAQQARAAYDADGQRMLDRYNMALNAANNAYAQGRDALADQRYDQERNYNMAMQMIQSGQTPDAALLQAAGIDPGYAQKMAAYYAAQLLPASGGGSSGGGGSGYKGGGGNGTNKKTQKAANQMATGAANAGILGAAAAAAGTKTSSKSQTYTDLYNTITRANDVDTRNAAMTKKLRNQILDAYEAKQITDAEAEELLRAIGLKQ